MSFANCISQEKRKKISRKHLHGIVVIKCKYSVSLVLVQIYFIIGHFEEHSPFGIGKAIPRLWFV